MKLKYKIIKTNLDLYKAQYFEGVWIFGSWKEMGYVFLSVEAAEKHIIKYASTVLASHDKVVRKITVE